MSEKRKQIVSKQETKKTKGGAYMRTVTPTMNRDAVGTVHTSEKVTYEPFVSPRIHIGNNDRIDTAYVSESLALSTEQTMNRNRQTDADLWEMLSFRGVTFADVISELKEKISDTPHNIPVNLIEKYAMCIVRSTFRDLIRKGADEWQVKVYDDFRHDIRLELSRRMANNTAYEMNRNRKGDHVRAVDNENAKKVMDNATAETFGSGMDLMHAVIVDLLENIADGHNFDETWSDSKMDKKIYNPWDEPTMREYENSIVQSSFKTCRDEIQRQASVKAVDNGYTYTQMTVKENGAKVRTVMHGQSMCIDSISVNDRDGYMDEEIYWRTKQNIFTGDCTSVIDLARFNDLVSDMHLTDTQMKRLELKARGYSVEQIAAETGVTKRAVQKSIEQIREKATKWLTAKGLEVKDFARDSEQDEISERLRLESALSSLTVRAEREQVRAQLKAVRSRQALKETENDCYDFDYWKQGYTDAETLYNREVKAREVHDAFDEQKANVNAVIVTTPWYDRRLSSEWTRENENK